MSMMELYFLLKLDSIKNLFSWILIAVIIVTAIYSLAQAMIISDCFEASEEIEGWERYKKVILKIFIPVMIAVALTRALLPSTKEMAFIYVASKITNSERAQRIGEKALDIPEKALDILTKKMNEYLEEQSKK